MPGVPTPAINTRVTITAKNINGVNATMRFNRVAELSFDYWKGMVKIKDLDQGEFYFGISAATVMTVTITLTATVIVIS